MCSNFIFNSLIQHELYILAYKECTLSSLSDFWTTGIHWSECYRTQQRSAGKNFSRKKIRSAAPIGDKTSSQIMFLFPPHSTHCKQALKGDCQPYWSSRMVLSSQTFWCHITTDCNGYHMKRKGYCAEI